MMSDKEMTVYTFDADIVSDLHKDAYGMRPSYSFWEEWNNSTDESRQEIWDNLLVALEHAIEAERKHQVEAIDIFESMVTNNIVMGAGDRANAIAWICDAYSTDNAPGMHGWEHLEYQLGLPYGYISGVKPGFKS